MQESHLTKEQLGTYKSSEIRNIKGRDEGWMHGWETLFTSRLGIEKIHDLVLIGKRMKKT